MDTAFATIAGRTTLHIVPNGNTHARCGRVVTVTVEGPEAGKAIVAGTHHVCKTCLRVKDPRDLTVVYMGEPTDVWEVTDKAGEKLGRITARDIHTAGRRARQVPSIDRVSLRDGGLSLRRLRTKEL